MIETPAPAPVPAPARKPLLESDLDNTVTPSEPLPYVPVTSSLFRVIRHVHQVVPGRIPVLRGVFLYVAYVWHVEHCAGWVTSYLPLPPSVIETLDNIISLALCARISTVWVHMVASSTTTQQSLFSRLYSRAPPAPMWLQIAVPALIVACLRYGTLYIVRHASSLLGITIAPIPERLPIWYGDEIGWLRIPTLLLMAYAEKNMWIRMKILLFLAIFILGALFDISCSVALTRVQASLLPLETETLVSFDRSFGGAVQPGQQVTLYAAWASFDWDATFRLLETYVKIELLQIILLATGYGSFAVGIYLLFDGGFPLATAAWQQQVTDKITANATIDVAGGLRMRLGGNSTGF